MPPSHQGTTSRSQNTRSTLMALPRLDLSSEHLLHLSIYKMYVSTSSRTVSIFLNRKFQIMPKLTTNDVEATYINLHDTENEIWVRAKNMNQAETELLKCMLADSGVRKTVQDSDLLKTAGPTACLRLPPSPGPGELEFKATADMKDSGKDKLDLEGTFDDQGRHRRKSQR